MMVILPLPPTDNNLRLPKRGKGRFAQMYQTSVYTQWKEIAGYIWDEFASFNKLSCPVFAPCLEEQFSFTYKLFKASDRADSQNFEKALRDFLSGRLYTDDRHVVLSLEMPVALDPSDPRIELCLTPTRFIYQRPAKPPKDKSVAAETKPKSTAKKKSSTKTKPKTKTLAKK